MKRIRNGDAIFVITVSSLFTKVIKAEAKAEAKERKGNKGEGKENDSQCFEMYKRQDINFKL